jgi:hypothetical protein
MQPIGDRVKRLRNVTAELSEADPKDNHPLPITDSILLAAWCRSATPGRFSLPYASGTAKPVIVIKAGPLDGHIHQSSHGRHRPRKSATDSTSFRGVFRLWTGMAIFPQGSYSLSVPVTPTPCCFFPVRSRTLSLNSETVSSILLDRPSAN